MVVLVLLCCVCAWWLVQQWRLLRLTANIPTLPGALPLIGHAHKIIGDSTHFVNLIKDASEKVNDCGGILKAWFGTDLYFVVTDPKVAQWLLNTCLEKSKVYDIAKPWLGEGLETAKVSIWKNHRKLLSPAFNQQVIDGFIDTFNQQSAKLVENINKEVGNGEFDPQFYLEATALATICQTAMGLSKKDEILFNNEYMNAVKKVHHIFTTRLLHVWMVNDFLYFWTKTKRDQDKHVKILKSMSSNVIKRRKSTRISAQTGSQDQHTGPRFKAFLDLLLDLEDEGSLTAQDVEDQVDTVIGAGFDTVSHTLLFIFVLIGSYSHVQEKIYGELADVFGKSNRDVTKDDLPKLIYMEAVIKETLRVFPVAPIVARSINEDIKFDNYTLPAGSNLVVSIWGLHHHKSWGEDAEIFRPERWLLPSSLPENPNAFAAFSIGRRSCIGKNYAMISMKISLAHVLRQYRVKADHTRLKLKSDVVLKSASGHQISLEQRVHF